RARTDRGKAVFAARAAARHAARAGGDPRHPLRAYLSFASTQRSLQCARLGRRDELHYPVQVHLKWILTPCITIRPAPSSHGGSSSAFSPAPPPSSSSTRARSPCCTRCSSPVVHHFRSR